MAVAGVAPPGRDSRRGCRGRSQAAVEEVGRHRVGRRAGHSSLGGREGEREEFLSIRMCIVLNHQQLTQIQRE